MKPTAFVYSSHDRSDYIHRQMIVERALESWDNKTIMHLPFSQRDQGQQEWDYGNFRWYYSGFEQYGLDHTPYFYNDYLRREDVDAFFQSLWHSQVVVLGGGNSSLGLSRYKQMGAFYYNDPGLFERILHERQERGLLTVGFSAGADQLCEYLSSCVDYSLPDPYGFKLLKNVVTTLHHENGREDEIYRLAVNLPHCLAFGLPNDSGVAGDQGVLPSGNIWQVLWFIEDQSWDSPRDQWHIKTRMGQKILHYYADGRNWSFNGGDKMVRIMSPEGQPLDAVIITNNGQFIDYWTQSPSWDSSIESILNRW
ncbi:MAG: hypothetical protein CVV64_10255 [Candidatus Wallbacteria bacterium HGW-Wallbacteria-1]|uniref:Cyanophycinase n=1 Tax=Candidatus Wallbacteria bacterium HGW-Wallbacteria-1 TaxID=2013854 RepID=A0A2N1PPV8_9BACT|nr:MAG: hypothetical protein CVV64_10255 [Candidatus Wallbacteria bacterium HGW-Wallbacteria-1]